MEHLPELAAAVESTADALLDVLESARVAQCPVIPPTQLRVLHVIAAHGRLNMNRLAELLDVVPSSATRLCDRMEAAGLVRRMPEAHDRREVRVVLTPTAQRLLDELRDRRRAALAEVLARMTPTTQAELARALAAFDQAAAVATAGACDDAVRRSA
ncbi:MAG TPA: MarR family transcriptional regulator [Actinoplanes sp.]|nr:MarR family transcriptional regulator [Actinoplanes sp.]